MARQSHPSVSTPYVICLLILLALLAGGANSSSISIYWGQNRNETELSSTCQTGYYGVVNIAFLVIFGKGQAPMLNLANHCDPASFGCSYLSSEIETCQSLGVKVFLSLFGQIHGSEGPPAEVGEYIWNNFLGGSSPYRPLGDAVLDGIDFNVGSGSPSYWAELAQYLADKSQPSRKVHLSAAPQCPYPDYWLGTALTTGRFDYVWVQFYNNPPCQYLPGNSENLINSWEQWTSSVQAGQFFLGLPASAKAVPSGGYIEQKTLASAVLPAVQSSPKYGGVMVWSQDYAQIYEYSAAITPYVFKNIPTHLRFAHAELYL